MANIKKLQKELLEITKKFARGKQTIKDLQRLAEILYYEAPFENSILPEGFNREELSVLVVQSITKDNQDSNTVTVGDHDDGRVRLSYDAIRDLGAALDTLGHEGTHDKQDKMVTARASGEIQLTPEMEEVVDSYEYGRLAQTNLYGMVNLSANQELDELYARNTIDNFENLDEEQRKAVLSKARGHLNYMSYKQLKYEEQARSKGHQYAVEILSALKQLKNCDPQTRAYIEACEKNLSVKWQRETNLRNADDYQILRKLHQTAIQSCANLDIHELAASNMDATLKLQLEDGVLFNLRRARVSQGEYYRALVAFHRDEHDLKDPNNISHYYLTGCDPKAIVIDALKDGSQSEEFALKNINFILPKDTILLTPEEISDLCSHWAKQGNLNKIMTILEFCHEDPTSSLMDLLGFSASLPKERQEAISKEVSSNYEIFDITDKEYKELLAKYQAIEGKTPSEMTDEELALCADTSRFHSLRHLRSMMGVEDDILFTPELRLAHGNVITKELARRKELASQQQPETPQEEDIFEESETSDGTVDEPQENTEEVTEDTPQIEEEVEQTTE